MICKTLSIPVLFAVLVVRPAGAGSVPSDAEAITAAVNGFHAQTREEYAREPLEEDIAFAKAVPGTRSKLSIKQEGNVAWTSATAQSIGTFKTADR